MLKNLQAVILAGGKGTRLGKLGKKVPKAMVDINGKPFLELIIEQLKKKGIKKFLVLTGYKRGIIQKYFRNNNNIKIHKGKTNWKMLTRLFKAKKLIKKNFLLMYCDNYLTNFNIIKNINLMKKKNSNIIFSIVKKKSNQNGTILEKNKKVYYKKNIKSNFAEAGYMLIKKKKFFSHLNKIKKREDLPNYLHFFSKKYLLYGVNYKKKFLCIENQYLLKKTRNYFKKKNKKIDTVFS